MQDVFNVFIAKVNTEFLDVFLDYANAMWVGYYTLFIGPTALFLGISSVGFMLGKFEGSKLRDLFNKFLRYLFLCLFGYGLLPAVEKMELGIEQIISSQGASAQMTLVDDAVDNASALNEKYKAEVDRLVEKYKAVHGKETNLFGQDVTMTNVLLGLKKEVTTNYIAIDPMEAKEMDELFIQQGLTYRALDDAQVANANKAKMQSYFSAESNVVESEDSAWYKVTFVEIVTKILSFFAGLLEVLVRMVRMFILIILRFTFPIALALSIIPGMESTIKSWWESYYTILMWGVTLIIVKFIISISASITVGAEDSTAAIMGAIFQFVGGVCYLLSPSITVMCFGGNSVVSQLPQQMVQAGAAVMSMTKWGLDKAGVTGPGGVLPAIDKKGDKQVNAVGQRLGQKLGDVRNKFKGK